MSTSGAGNYFRPQATLCLYLSFAGYISVKKSMTKLRKLAFASRMWPAGRMLPTPALDDYSLILSFVAISIINKVNTVKPVYNDHP